MKRWILPVVLAAVVVRTQDAPAARSPRAPVTYRSDIAPILAEHCTSCHRPGGIGSFPLLSYADVRPRATQIAQVTERRQMPPWKPAEPRGTFLGDRSLTDEQIELFRQWVVDGAIEGSRDDRALPSPAIVGDGGDRWQLGTPDLVLRMDQPFEVPSDGADLFRTFVLPIRLPASRLVRAIEFHPGNARVVHHANFSVDRTEASRRRDEREPGPGYAGGRIPEADHPRGQMLGWTPGESPRPAPEGTAWRLDPGSYFNVELHILPSGRPERVQASVGLFFTELAPTRVPVILRLGSQTIAIPAGDASHVISDSYVLPVDVEVISAYAHAHYLGRRFEARASLPDGSERALLTIPDWDFHWQDLYVYARPLVLPAGTVVHMRVSYDNSSSNPRNPHRPPRAVVWGQSTLNEMGDLWLQVVPVKVADAPRLGDDMERKMAAANLAAFTKIVEREPGNAQVREQLAILHLQAGRVQDALVHLRELLRLKPDAALGHYNLGNALTMNREYEEAVREFERALALDPSLGEAHTNLGAALSMLGRADEGWRHFQRAVDLQPDSAEAHANLGRSLAGQRRAGEAAAHFQKAIDLRPDLVSALVGLAWIRAAANDSSLRNAADAVRLAERAVAITQSRDASALDALAAAQAEGGRFDQAVVTARLAVDAASAAGASALAAEIRARLVKYEGRVR